MSLLERIKATIFGEAPPPPPRTVEEDNDDVWSEARRAIRQFADKVADAYVANAR